MAKVFLSYKRSDCTAHVGVLYDRLCAALGGRKNVFLDVTEIAGGEDFASVIDRAVSAADVLVLLVGASWLTLPSEPSSTIDPYDWVRVEVEAALKNHLFVIPVLLDDTPLAAINQRLGARTPVAKCNTLNLREQSISADADRIVSDVLRVTSRPYWRARARARCLRIRIGFAHERISFVLEGPSARVELNHLEQLPGSFETLLKRSIAEGWTEDSLRRLMSNGFPSEVLEALGRSGTVVFDADARSAHVPLELICQFLERADTSEPFRYRPIVRNGFLQGPTNLAFVTPSDCALVADLAQQGTTAAEASKGRMDRAVETLSRTDSMGRVLDWYKAPSGGTAEVMQALFERAYRVVFLSGFGVMKPIDTETSKCPECGQPRESSRFHVGLRFSDQEQLLLSPNEFQAMSYLPQMVFIELQGMDGESGSAPPAGKDEVTPWRDHYAVTRFADAYARDLLLAGVSFVVIYDASQEPETTRRFAILLWYRMLRGDKFGRAIELAMRAHFRNRTSIPHHYPPLCFGDPTLSLTPAGKFKAPGSDG